MHLLEDDTQRVDRKVEALCPSFVALTDDDKLKHTHKNKNSYLLWFVEKCVQMYQLMRELLRAWDCYRYN